MIIKMKVSTISVVPQVEKIAREMTANSQVMIIVKKLMGLSPIKIVQIGWNNIVNLPRLAKKDFAAGIILLTELEIIAKAQGTHWILHPQMTDMAIALKNKRVLTGFFRLAKIYDFQPGISTNNLQHLLLMLSDISGVPKDLIIYTPQDKLGKGLIRYLTESQTIFADWKGR